MTPQTIAQMTAAYRAANLAAQAASLAYHHAAVDSAALASAASAAYSHAAAVATALADAAREDAQAYDLITAATIAAGTATRRAAHFAILARQV